MNELTIGKPKRIESIDVLRGIVMVLMALDHVRDYFHISANVDNPLNLETTTPLLFFTRWITHFCAPVFVFLSGTSIYLQSRRKSKNELSIFLIKRGFWLILVEITIVSFAWSFNPHYQFVFLQVIWAIGISMVILGFLIRMPYLIVLILGLAITIGHNLLDIPEAVSGFHAGLLWDLIHHGFLANYPYAENHSVKIIYPFLPWTGLMILGYCIGIYFTHAYSQEQRRKILSRLGLMLILSFIVIRAFNVYGDPVKWSFQKSSLFTFFSFIDVNKYPPSLMYMCITIGPALLLLSYLEKIQNNFTSVMKTYGRVAFFYYILHLYLIHILATCSYFLKGHSFSDLSSNGTIFRFYFVVPGEGYNLGIVYAIWVIIVISLYPACKWYDAYKTLHREKWWLSYL